MSLWFIGLLVVGAAICKAIADTLAHHFSRSVFRNGKPAFWNPDVSWHAAPYLPFTTYKVDAWHLFNSGMIVCFCAAIALHKPVYGYWWELIGMGVLHNAVFNIFYNKLLLK